jgi:hypothetical protein
VLVVGGLGDVGKPLDSRILVTRLVPGRPRQAVIGVPTTGDAMLQRVSRGQAARFLRELVRLVRVPARADIEDDGREARLDDAQEFLQSDTVRA